MKRTWELVFEAAMRRVSLVCTRLILWAAIYGVMGQGNGARAASLTGAILLVIAIWKEED